MNNKKHSKYYVEWWNVRKSTVYGIAAIVIFLLLLAGGGWWFLHSNFAAPVTENSDVPKDAAQIVQFEGDVRIIRAATRETILVTRKTYVTTGDTIQTQADGRAQVQMIDGSTLSIRPNSTVVIRDSQSLFGGTNVRVKLDDGQINVKTQNQTDETQNVVELMESKNRMLSETDASFNINDQTNGGEIRISRGGVESSVGDEKTLIKDGEFAAVNNGKLSKERLLLPPKLTSPTAAEQITTASNDTSDVTLRWQKPESTFEVNYALQVAKSPFFVPDSMILQRDSLNTTNFTFGNITPGIYYWRVRASAASSGQISEWSEPLKFAIVKRENSPQLTATEWQVERIGGSIYNISGITQAGAAVRCAGRETFANGNGSFSLQISNASSETTVEISDENGNRSRYALSLSSGKAIRQ